MSLVVRIDAPTGRDAELLVKTLTDAGIAAEACRDVLALLQVLGHDALGPLLIAEECLTPAFIASISAWLQAQPEWSDLPILILTTSGRETDRTRQLQRERLPLGVPVLLERPIRMATLLSSVQAAVRARERQYQVRATLSELNRVAMELKAEQDTLKAVLNSMPVGVAVSDAQGKLLMTNPALARTLRRETDPRPDGTAHAGWSVFHGDGRRVSVEDYPLRKAVVTGVTVASEDYLYESADGARTWIRLSAAPIVNEDGVVTGGVAALMDIDEERQMEDSRRRSDERFRLLIEHASIGVAIGDTSGGLSYVNPALLQMLGYTQEEMKAGAIRWDRITPAEYAQQDAHAVEQLRAHGVAEPYQKAYMARDGRAIPLLVGAVQIPSSALDGRQEVAVFLTDLTSQKQAESALIQSEKLAAVGRLAASISHEINNPLEAVTNLLYLAATEELSTTVRQYLDQASKELARVSQIAGQTLRFHRQSTKPRSVTPQELLSSVLALYQGRMLNAHVEAVTEYRGVPEFVAYEGDIRQVLNNLVGNAIDAMRGAGTLRVRSRAAADARTGVRGVRITVADTGHGMNEDVVRHIFEPFFTTKGIHGTGLGLWISKGIIDKHNGYLRVRSRTGKGGTGTVFALFLPVVPQS